MSSLFPQQEKLGRRQIERYERSRPDVVSLALLVSPARKIEIELLRRLRLELANYFLPEKQPTVGTEAALWFSSLVESRGADSITLLPGVLDLLRRQLKEQHGELLEKIRPIISNCHENIPPVIRWEEDLIYYSLSSVKNFKELRDTILTAANTILNNDRKSLEEWVNKMSVRVPAELLNHDDFKNLLSLSQSRLIKPKTLTNFTEPPSASADKVLQIKRSAGEIIIGHNLENADYQIGVPKTTPVTVIIWNSSNPGNKRSHIITPEENISAFLVPNDSLFLQTTDRRIYQVPFDESAMPKQQSPEPEKSISRPLNEARMLVVGNAGVGKTSLISRLVHNNFSQSTKLTQGMQIASWKLPLNGEEIQLNIHEFGGQEIMSGLSQFFFTPRSLYLLVLDGRQNNIEKNAEYWLKLIQHSGISPPVIVVLSKVTVSPFEVHENELLQKYPFIKAFIKTDSATDIGFSKLREAVQQEISNLENLRQPIPASWFAIKEALVSLNTKHLTIEQYEKLCEDFGVTDKVSQVTLIELLHELGCVLNFKDNDFLSRIISNPEWVTNGIYRILKSEMLISRRGEIYSSDLAEILPDNEYPRDVHHFLLEVMKKFEISFSLPGNTDGYLIPQSLDDLEPIEASEFDRRESLNFEYQYEMLPPNLIHQFIVRMRFFSESKSHWRSGAIYEFQEARALVKADTADKKIRISIAGNTNLRRDFLSIIRREFEEVHKTYSELGVKERIPLPEYPDTAVSYDKLIKLEENGKMTFTEFIGDEVVQVNVQALLNGIAANPQEEKPGEKRNKKFRVFCSYSLEDKKLYEEFIKHIAASLTENLIESWYDRTSVKSGDFFQESMENLENSDIVLLLISPKSIASDLFHQEMDFALEQYSRKKTTIISILLRPANWRNLPVAKFQILPENAIPVTEWKNRNEAWTKVSHGVIEAMRGIIFESES